MSKIIRAKVLTNSSDDENARVKLSSEGLWKESPLVDSVGGIALKAGDLVYVDISEGYNNPLILGRSYDKSEEYEHPVEGTVIFESSDGTNWSLAFVKNNKLEFYNSDNVSLVIDGSKITLNADKVDATVDTVNVDATNVKIDASKIKLDGDVEFTKKLTGTSASMLSQSTKGFCQIPICPFSGAPHLTNEV